MRENRFREDFGVRPGCGSTAGSYLRGGPDPATRGKPHLAVQVSTWMKRPLFPAASLLLLAFLVLTGCSTFTSRAKEREATFSQLDEMTRERLRNREIFVGDNFDMVYIALGAPDEKRQKVTESGMETVWIYNRYWQEYHGSHVVGYERYVVYNPRTKSYFVFYRPVRENIYSDRVEERMRVYFQDGQVTAIEQAQ